MMLLIVKFYDFVCLGQKKVKEMYKVVYFKIDNEGYLKVV